LVLGFGGPATALKREQKDWQVIERERGVHPTGHHGRPSVPTAYAGTGVFVASARGHAALCSPAQHQEFVEALRQIPEVLDIKAE
jgi:hypothetical protein